MKQVSILFAMTVALALPPFAAAADTAGNSIFVPVVSRTPGALGSEWRTDLVISNVSRRPVNVPFTITFTPNDGSPGTSMHGEIGPRTSRAFFDVVNIGFGRSTGVGVVHVTSSAPDARLTARARIYNVASPNGEFGQHVPGSRLVDLQREHHLAGLTGVAGSRSNVGIANPWNEQISFWVNVFQGEGEFRFSAGWWTLEPRQVYQINDIFSWIGTEPFANATVEITTSAPAYVYGSLVRTDSGDPIFVQSVNPADSVGGVVTPTCAAPAPLHLATNPAEGWIVVLQDDTNAASAATLLSQKYEFTVRTLYEDAFRGFTAIDVSPAAIAGLRCEAVVKFIEQNEAYQWPGN